MVNRCMYPDFVTCEGQSEHRTGGGGGAGPGTANSISRRQRDRVMVHGHGLRSKKPTIRPRVVVVLRLG